jgi:hypothetical protein
MFRIVLARSLRCRVALSFTIRLNGCSVGLHVGTYDYASNFTLNVLEVHVNPRDVVSVPTDSNWAKVRCCRYVVIKEVERTLHYSVSAARGI